MSSSAAAQARIRRSLDVAEIRRAEARAVTNTYTINQSTTRVFEPGDKVVDLVWPAQFTEMPFVAVCFAHDGASKVVQGAYPIIGTPQIDEWDERRVDGIPVYVGARVFVAFQAMIGVRGTLIWQITGPANVGPTTDPQDD